MRKDQSYRAQAETLQHAEIAESIAGRFAPALALKLLYFITRAVEVKSWQMKKIGLARP